jgi:glycosyltransferase involved in cell wall biosynthesis
MRLGVDATAFFGVAAGVSRYLSGMLESMMSFSSADEFLLYSPRPVDVPIACGGWRARFPREWRGQTRGRWLREVLPRLLAEDGVDAFWGQSPVVPLRRLRPCRTVLTVHDLTGLLCPRTMELSTRLYWKFNLVAAVRAADMVAAVSHATGQLVRRLLGKPAGQVIVVHEGFSNALGLVTRTAAQAMVAKRFGLPERFLLAVGTIEPRKDLLTLLDVVRRNREFPLVAIAGAPGWKSRRIFRTIKAAEDEGRARYLGRVSDQDLSALYAAATAMVYPSTYEGFGLPVLEAMAFGCPVLCSWSSSLPEVGGSAARYFRPHDATDLTYRLRGILHDERQLAEMRAMGPVQAACFSFDEAAGQMLRVLRGDGRVSR